jgi:hypothetical protein
LMNCQHVVESILNICIARRIKLPPFHSNTHVLAERVGKQSELIAERLAMRSDSAAHCEDESRERLAGALARDVVRP